MATISQVALLAEHRKFSIALTGGIKVVPTAENPQMHITGDGNIQALGNITISKLTNPLETLLRDLDFDTEESKELLAISAELQTYFSNRDVIGLEGKLISAGRIDLLEDAIYEKHRFSQKLALLQFTLQLRKVYHHLLAMLVQRFRNGVLPLIRDGASFAEVDAATMKLVSDVYSYTTASNVLNLTETDVHAMIFFLTGNCHLKWNK